MQTASTHIARQLNAMSHSQQQAVRTLVELMILTGTPESIYDILSATDFMSDLVENEEDEDDLMSEENDATIDDLNSDSTSDDNEDTDVNDEGGSSAKEDENDHDVESEDPDTDMSDDVGSDKVSQM
ncbi:hypothetical protein VNI00_005333 [Paramarasmius palmivorus]|uniref:Uncharacterized protein n=1 Tax=Paramarasmius palmivorus TaxID=297713 RepID=A0AAW0DBG2_9AGAR